MTASEDPLFSSLRKMRRPLRAGSEPQQVCRHCDWLSAYAMDYLSVKAFSRCFSFRAEFHFATRDTEYVLVRTQPARTTACTCPTIGGIRSIQIFTSPIICRRVERYVVRVGGARRADAAMERPSELHPRILYGIPTRK